MGKQNGRQAVVVSLSYLQVLVIAFMIKIQILKRYVTIQICGLMTSVQAYVSNALDHPLGLFNF